MSDVSFADFENEILSSVGEDANADDTQGEQQGTPEQQDATQDPTPTQTQEPTDAQTPSGQDILDGIAEDTGGRPRYQTDAAQNVVDPKTGQIIAKAGTERRFYEETHKAKAAYGELKGRYDENVGTLQKAQTLFNEMQAEIQAYKTAGTQGNQLGLDLNQQSEALNLYKEGLTNPVAVVKKILTTAAEMGYNLEELEKGTPFDLKGFKDSVVSSVQDVVQPLREHHDVTQAQQQMELDATNEINSFINAEPEAQPHLETLGKMMSDPRFSEYSLREVWYKLQNYLLRQGQSQNTQPRQPAKPVVGMPNGRGAGGVESVVAIDNSPVAPDDDYRDILKGVFDDYKVQL